MKRIAFLAALAVSAIAGAHMWLVTEGVHFILSPTDFGTPPSKYAAMVNTDMESQQVNTWRPGTEYVVHSDTDYVAEAAIQQQALIEWAVSAESKGKWPKAIMLWSKYRRLYHLTGGYADEHIAVCEMGRKGLPLQDAQALFKGLWPNGPLSTTSSDPRVLELVNYDKLIRSRGKARELSNSFLSLYRSSPNGYFAGSCLLMAANELLGSSNDHPTRQDVATAESALNTLQARFPHSRLQIKALGWRARIDYLRGNPIAALAIYRRQLALGIAGEIVGPSIVACGHQLQREDLEAEGFLDMFGSALPEKIGIGAMWFSTVLNQFTDVDAKRFWRRLEDNPSLLRLYLDYRLQFTNHTQDLLALGRRVLAHLASGPNGGEIAARLAEAAFRYKRYGLAQSLAQLALRKSNDHESADLAWFVLAGIAKRRGRLTDATVLYRKIARSPHPTYLAGGALQNLALIEESRGNLFAALDIYRELDFSFDVAYLLDAKMTPDQVAGYIRSHPSDGDLKSLRLAAGFRFMRAGRWREAAAEFGAIDRKVRQKMMLAQGYYTFDDDSEHQLTDPLLTVYDLAHLDRAVHKAHSPSERAAALFVMGDYYYHNRNLLLYNPRLWHGFRAMAFQGSWNDDVASDTDRSALNRYNWEHECLARAYQIYSTVARAYPRTRIGYRAAYWAGTSLEKLGRMNTYWRWVEVRQRLDNRAARWMLTAAHSPERKLAIKANKYAGEFAEESDAWDSESGYASPHFSGWVAQNKW